MPRHSWGTRKAALAGVAAVACAAGAGIAGVGALVAPPGVTVSMPDAARQQGCRPAVDPVVQDPEMVDPRA